MEFQVRQARSIVRYYQLREEGMGKMKASLTVAKSLYPECGNGTNLSMSVFKYIITCMHIYTSIIFICAYINGQIGDYKSRSIREWALEYLLTGSLVIYTQGKHVKTATIVICSLLQDEIYKISPATFLLSRTRERST
jgi:hypothetical protein